MKSVQHFQLLVPRKNERNKYPISGVFGLRSPVVQKQINAKSDTSRAIVARVKTLQVHCGWRWLATML